jgi:hypothetical protein
MQAGREANSAGLRLQVASRAHELAQLRPVGGLVDLDTGEFIPYWSAGFSQARRELRRGDG